MRAIHALVALPMLLAVPAMAQDRAVQVVNASGFSIVEFYASTVGPSDWQEDMLFGQTVSSGSTLTVNLDDGTAECAYSFRAVFEDGEEAVGQLDACSGIGATIN